MICQAGAESALKFELAREWPELRLSFSRPGFVTCKLPDDNTIAEDFDLRSVFARTYGFSLGKVVGQDASRLAQETWSLLGDRGVDHIHCWQRDPALPGVDAFEPGSTPLAEEVGRLLASERSQPVNRTAKPGQAILDCVLVEPNEWWIGWHRAATQPTRWPGGVPALKSETEIINRAYLKMAEAMRWSQLPVSGGDLCVEIGSAPGGSAQFLLERGLYVLGIDPAEMDERVLAHPHFAHIRKRAADVKRRELTQVRWLFADSNVAPKHTLDSVEAIVTHGEVHVRGMLLMLKLPDWQLADQIPEYLERVRSWGFRYVRARQLAFNRQEICVCAMRNRAMRRFKPRHR
jgi:23S rRNA (cytidine2498-2'-O)-methyltransferase